MMESALFFFSYRYSHRSLLLAAPFNLHNGKVAVWSCSFCRTQTIHLRLANNMFMCRKQYVYGA